MVPPPAATRHGNPEDVARFAVRCLMLAVQLSFYKFEIALSCAAVVAMHVVIIIIRIIRIIIILVTIIPVMI